MTTKAEVTYTFSVTFKAPTGMSIKTARGHIKEGLQRVGALELSAPEDLKVSLTNKEVVYGKR